MSEKTNNELQCHTLSVIHNNYQLISPLGDSSKVKNKKKKFKKMEKNWLAFAQQKDNTFINQHRTDYGDVSFKFRDIDLRN